MLSNTHIHTLRTVFCCVILDLLLCIQLGHAQVYDFDLIGLEQGMPNSRVNDMLRDSRGIYWIATEGNGLLRYDGYDFKTYTSPSQGSRLFMTSLMEDAHGNIWVTLEQGVLKFDGHHQYEYTVPGSNSRLRSAALYDSLHLVVADQAGAMWLVDQNGPWDSLVAQSAGMVNHLQVKDQKVWIAAKKGLKVLRDNAIHLVDSGEVLKLVAGEKELYALFRGELRVYDYSGQHLRTRVAPWKDIFLSEDYGLALANGELTIRKQAGKLIKLSDENGLPQQDYKGCYADDNGVIWLFSNKGLVKLESLDWRTYTDLGSASSQVFGICQDKENSIYTGLVSGFAHVQNGAAKVYDRANGFPYGLTLSIAAFEGDIWLGTENGLIRKSERGFQEVRTPGGGDFVFSMKNSSNRLWLGMGAGLFSYSNGRIENVSQKNDLPPATIFSISEGQDGSLWCGTYTQGFFRYADGEWQVLTEMNGIRLDSLRFSCFAAKNKNELWAGSLTEGVFHFSSSGVSRIPVEKFGFAEIQSMAISGNGSVWMGTNKGIYEIRNGNPAHIIKLPYVAGQNGQSCTPQSIAANRDKLLVGTTEGLQVLDLDGFQSKKPEPELILTDIKLFLGQNNSLPEYADDSLRFTLLPAEVRLPHDLNFLSFNFSGLTEYQKENLQYRYRLRGQSDEWTVAGSRREAVFPNIKPGEYTFQAQVSRLGEAWSPVQVEYQFRILRPVWMRWWFITFTVLLLGGLTLAFIMDRVKRVNHRLRLENALLEMERKALRLQMNPHFIFNALDSISSFIFKKDPEKAVRYLNNFAKLMRLTLESSMEHLHPVETEVSILKNYLELEKLRFQGKFEYHIEVDDEMDYDVGIPPMLIQPHVENAILHGLKPLEHSGKLDIRFILEDDLLIVEVEDNGIGRKRARELNKRKDHRSMATQINRDRLRLLRVSMSEKVDITIEDKLNSDGTAAGTKVVIKLPAESI